MAEGSVQYYARSGVRVEGIGELLEAAKELADDALEAYAKRLVTTLQRILPARSPVRTGRLAGGWKIGLLKTGALQVRDHLRQP